MKPYTEVETAPYSTFIFFENAVQLSAFPFVNVNSNVSHYYERKKTKKKIIITPQTTNKKKNPTGCASLTKTFKKNKKILAE